MRLIQLDELTINPHLSSVLIGEQEVSLDPKLLDLLLLLCHHKNQIVTRHQILESIWPNSIVTDNAVNKLVASLRKVLKDEPKSPKYIQTIPKRGYRLIASVEHIDNSEQDIAKNAVQDSRKNSTQTPATEVELNTPRAQETKTQETSTGILPRKFFALFAIGLLTAVAYIGLLWRPSPLEATSIQSTLLNTRELTRMPGLERSPLMSEDQSFIVYLRESPETGHRSLWRKELANEKETLIKGISPYVSRLVSIETEQKHWKL